MNQRSPGETEARQAAQLTRRVEPDTNPTAVLEVRLLPWRPRARRMNPDTLRHGADSIPDLGGDLTATLISIAVWALIVVAAPLLVVLLAIAFLPVELAVVLIAAALLVLIRFVGIVPWTVCVTPASGPVRTESYRALPRALRRVRELNDDHRVAVRWSWS